MHAAVSYANRVWLPYWAVFQTDLRQTLQSWVYRLWVVAVALTGFGYLIYRLGVHTEAGLIQQAAVIMSDLLRWVVLGSTALIAALTVGCISSERGTLADSVLSRGISRYQYYLAKWHARLAAVLGTFAVLAVAMLAASHFLLHEGLTLRGSAAAVALIAGLLMVVVSLGVALSALCNSTLLGMSILWLLLYGGGFLLELLPKSVPSPDRVLHQLPEILKGEYDPSAIAELLTVMAALSLVGTLVGLVGFARRDV